MFGSYAVYIVILDLDECMRQKGKLLFCNPDYRQISSLQRYATNIVTLKHNVMCKHFNVLTTYLLTPAVTSALCERAHIKVNCNFHSCVDQYGQSK
jgi:hypothetical protein